MFPSSFRIRLFVGFGGLTLATLIVVGLVSLFGLPLSGRPGLVDTFIDNELNRLNVAADMRKGSIEVWLRERRANLDVMAHSASLQRLLSGRPTDEARQILQNTVQTYTNGYDGLDGLAVVARDGSVLAESDDHPTREITQPVVAQAFATGNVESMAMVATGANSWLLMSHQVLNADGNAVAVVFARVNPATALGSALAPGQREWLGGTSEAYFIDEDQVLLTPLKFPLSDGSTAQPLHTRIASVAARLAAQGDEGAEAQPDYRGVPALIAYRHLRLSPGLGWGLVLKTDQAEALAPLWDSIRHVLVAGMAGIAAFLAAAAVMTGMISRPLRELDSAARRIERGDFSVQVDQSGLNEFAMVGKTFNKMAARIDEWHRRMQEELDARTRDLRAERDRSRALVDALVEGVLLFGADGRVQASNAAAQTLFGLSEADLEGRTDAELGWAPLAETEGSGRPVATALAGAEPVRNQVMGLESPAGRRLWVLVNAQPLIAEGTVVAAVASLVDITDQREAMRAQERLSAELARSNADLEQFSYAVSHDLQEPLRMVSSFVALLARRYDGLLDAEGREFIAFAVEGAQRMQQMITDLLEYSRVHRRGDNFGDVDLAQAVDAALLNLSAAVTDCGGTVATATPLPHIVGDHGQLVRLFQNLIGNALKFRAPDTHPTITIAAERRPDGWWLSVADDGIGIPATDIPRLFGVFQRLHPRDRYPGTGVGLALCRRIVERHGGRIEITSPGPGQGTTVGFLLPDTQPSP